MAMKKCKECGAEISSSAKTCPHCGKKQKYTGLVIFIAIIVIFFGIIVANSINDTLHSPQNQNNTKVTLEKFNQIQTGMTYQQVVDIIGEEGTLSTESSAGNQTMQIYYWYAQNEISNATISIMNGKVNAKSQIGLD